MDENEVMLLCRSISDRYKLPLEYRTVKAKFRATTRFAPIRGEGARGDTSTPGFLPSPLPLDPPHPHSPLPSPFMPPWGGVSDSRRAREVRYSAQRRSASPARRDELLPGREEFPPQGCTMVKKKVSGTFF